MIKIPNILTIGRIILVPILVFVFFLPGPLGNWLACGIFVLASFTDFVDGLLERDSNGYIIPSVGSQVRTSIDGLFAAGDCVDHVYRQAITAAGMGCQSAIEAERWLAEKE